MNVVLVIPTGIEAAIGGHAGDANPVARLLGAVCDNLITHPNVVNGSDINEMPPNTLYVEGSMLDRFLEGDITLRKVKNNRILVVANAPVPPETINAVSAARVTLGIEASIEVLKTPLVMKGRIVDGIATGDVFGWQELAEQVYYHDFDALAIHSPIEVGPEVAVEYYRNGGVNPWGGVEAKASKLIACALDKPVAHAPKEFYTFDTNPELMQLQEVVDPRIAPEFISTCYLHCVLKGLHKAPRIGPGLSVEDVDCMLTPINCVGKPHRACLDAGVPVIAVKENTTCLNDPMPESFIIVENYHEAAGVVVGMKEGISRESLRRPTLGTVVNAS